MENVLNELKNFLTFTFEALKTLTQDDWKTALDMVVAKIREVLPF